MSGEDAALAAAQALVDRDEYRAAIELLTAANRRGASIAIETRLVGLRHAGFAAAANPTPWPPTPADPFPGARGVPEIAAAALSAAALGGALQHHGCLLVRGLVPPARAALLGDDIDRAFAAYDAMFEGRATAEDARWLTPFSPGDGSAYTPLQRHWGRLNAGILLADSPRSLYDVTETWAAIGLGRHLADYLGEWPALSFKKCTLRRTPPDAKTEWHQDGAFLGTATRTVNIWLACTPCGEDAPGLDVVPRRLPELAPMGTASALFDWSVASEEADRLAAGDVARPVFAAGDALCFDQMTLHRTAVDASMTRTRWAIESWFFAPSTYPLDQVPILL